MRNETPISLSSDGAHGEQDGKTRNVYTPYNETHYQGETMDVKFTILLATTLAAASANIYTAYKVKKTVDTAQAEMELQKQNMENVKKNMINTLNNLEF